MLTITLVSPGINRPEDGELHRLEADDQYIRASLFGRALNSDILDERFLQSAPTIRRVLYKPLPTIAAQIIEAFLVKRRYDAIISWSEQLGLPLALLLKLMASRVPNVIIASWISKPKKALLLKRVQSHIDRLILMSSVQRDFAVNVLKLPPQKVIFLKWPVDQKFWRPMGSRTDMICTVGSEMRDFRTFVLAMRGLDIKCHIAAGTQRAVRHSTVKAIWESGPLPHNISVGAKSFAELRELYARSRFVVIPLLQSETDNGTTSILEAMAMGKAVICSRTKGQGDVIQDGKTGLFVPQGDPKALRDAIQFLWERPDEAERMGMEAREYIEQYHTLDEFVQKVKEVVEGAIDEHTGKPRRVECKPVREDAARELSARQ
jgi:glycosyltransferase involved in cell wall biosynthesis